MILLLPGAYPYVRFRLTSTDKSILPLSDVSAFLYDLSLLYEISRLATDPKYESFRFYRSPFFFARKARPIEDIDRLILERLRHESPLETSALVLASTASVIGAIWGVVQVVERISNWSLNRRKLVAEIAKLERDNAVKDQRVETVEKPSLPVRNEDTFNRVLVTREADYHYNRVATRLAFSNVKIKDFDIDVITESPGEKET